MKTNIFYTKKEIKEIKLALISDIHYYTPNYNTKILISIIKQIKQENPNYICIIGDILDESKYTELEELKNFFNELAYIAPVFVTLGNHDEKTYKNGKCEYLNNPVLKNMLKKGNKIHFLRDNAITINNITFYGFNPSHTYYKNKEDFLSFVEEAKKLKGNLSKENYNIVLCHSPINIYKFIKENQEHFLSKADIILSGHMHNGCLPKCISDFINKKLKSSRTLISPQKTLFPKYAQGRIYNELTDGYTTRGIIKLSKVTKILHPLDRLYKKQVEFITITNEKNK